MTRADLELHIEQLVLDGVPYDQRHRVRAAVERNLASMLEHRVGGQAQSDSHLDSAAVDIQAGSSVAAIGRQVASAVMQQLGGGSCP